MVALAMTGFIVGSALGLRFRVLILLPMEVAALAAAALAVVLGSVSPISAMLGFAVFSVSSQISYALSLSLPLLWHSRAG